MNILFDVEPQFPQGFSYFPDFLSPGEEEELLTFISGMELSPFRFQGYEARRKVASFGYDYNFEGNGLVKGPPIPQPFEPLVKKVAEYIPIPYNLMAELLVTEYPPGSVINWHRDAPPFDLIAGVSLLGDCIFRLRPYQKEKQGRHAVISFPVRRCSLYVMRGTAREEWQHSIGPLPSTRYSITLRTLRKGPESQAFDALI